MLSRPAILIIAFQTTMMVGLVLLGWGLYELRQDVDRGRTSVAMEAVSPLGQPAPATLPIDRSTASHEQLLLALSRRLESLEQNVLQLDASVRQVQTSGALARSNSVAGFQEALVDEEERARLVARADLRGRFQSEASVSQWGQAAARALEDASLAAASSSPFFAEHGGNVATDCRESVCSLAWSPPASALLSNEEKADLLERAKWELMSLAGAAEQAGQVKIFIDPAADPPTVELMLGQNSGGDANMPDRVSEYLGLKTGATKGQ